MLMAPDAGGLFVGDYEGMAVDRNGRDFHTFFAMTNCNDTSCPSVATPAPAAGTVGVRRRDPMDVYRTVGVGPG